MAISTKKGAGKKYLVGASYLSRFAFTDTLEEAKKAGAAIARKEAWHGKWNLMWLTIDISKRDAPGSVFYRPTGWRMYVPVRGTGRSADYILAELKRRTGGSPLKWMKKGK